MHSQDGGMHAAFDQNKSIYQFENQARYGIIVNEVYISFSMFFQTRQLNLYYHISFKRAEYRSIYLERFRSYI
jgi:hypothetical protein